MTPIPTVARSAPPASGISHPTTLLNRNGQELSLRPPPLVQHDGTPFGEQRTPQVVATPRPTASGALVDRHGHPLPGFEPPQDVRAGLVLPDGMPARPLRTSSQSVHLTQSASDYTPSAPSYATMTCGPTSALMALRSVGIDLPYLGGERSQDAILAAQFLTTGTLDDQEGSYPHLVRNLLRSAGANVKVSTDLGETVRHVQDGNAAMIVGDSAFVRSHDGWRYQNIPESDYGTGRGMHWVTLTRGTSDDTLTLHDPGLASGPEQVRRDEVERFLSYPKEFLDYYARKSGVPADSRGSTKADMIALLVDRGPTIETPNGPVDADPGA